MKINLNECKYYFLTCNNELRKNHMIQEFNKYDLTEVIPIIGIGKNKSGSSGFSRIFNLATKNQDINKPFQPFVIFEDDVTKYRDFPEVLDIPDDADILYIGISIYGMNKHTHCHTVCYVSINDDIIKISNMLSTHGIIICSIRGLLALQKCVDEAYFMDTVWDILFAQIQPYYNVYALRKPLVYQSTEFGGYEDATRIEHNDNEDKLIDLDWINKTNFSIVTIL